MFTAASYGNLPFYGVLPMGISNYGGDRQIYSVPDYSSRQISLNLNVPAQLQLAQCSEGGMGGMNIGINMPSVSELADAMYNAGMNSVAQSEVASSVQGVSSMKTRLSSLEKNEDISEDDKKEVQKQLAEIEKLEKEIEELKNSENLSPQEAYNKAKDINSKLKDILSATTDIEKRIKEAQEAATEAEEDAAEELEDE